MVACKVCADTKTGVPLGYVSSIDSTHFGNKSDSVYNTQIQCPACNGEKYFYREVEH
tara:strand:- start:253 stop:423 length:171 start_codon:yes stop_codon:yes gene_type:complete